MILYFSSTGNCRYIAESLATSLKDQAVSILESDHVHLKSGEKLGFVFPTYFWRLPSIVTDYMNRLTLTSEDAQPYIYFIATFGGTSGQTATYMRRHLKAKGYRLSFAYGIKTVDDWTVWYDVQNWEEIQGILQEEARQLREATDFIRGGTLGRKMKHTLPMIAVMGSNYFYGRARRTKHLHVEDTCIGCGLCEKECPTKSIQLKDGRPVWVNRQCTMCLHCLHSCPKFAIQYDDKTKQHGQYRHP